MHVFLVFRKETFYQQRNDVFVSKRSLCIQLFYLVFIEMALDSDDAIAACVHALKLRFVGREAQIEQLVMSFGPREAPVPPIWISGNKTSIIKCVNLLNPLSPSSCPHFVRERKRERK